MSALSWVVPGPPVAWERPGGRGKRYTPSKTLAHEGRVASLGWLAARESGLVLPIESRVGLLVRAFSGPRDREKDWDNVGKAVSDGLNGSLLVDDRQVKTAAVELAPCERGDQPRTEVRLVLGDELTHTCVLCGAPRKT